MALSKVEMYHVEKDNGDVEAIIEYHFSDDHLCISANGGQAVIENFSKLGVDVLSALNKIMFIIQAQKQASKLDKLPDKEVCDDCKCSDPKFHGCNSKEES